MFKRFVGILCLLFICVSASAAVNVRLEDGAVLLNPDGEVIVGAGEYRDIVSLGKNLFAAGDSGAYALMNAYGREVSKPVYDYFECGEHAIIAEKDGMRGMIGQDGTEISAFRYSSITVDESGICWALAGEADSAQGMQLYILDKNGNETDTGFRLLDIGSAPYQGLLSVRTADGRYGYIDRNGEMAIPAQYQYASDFINGCAAAVIDDKYCAINSSGDIIVPAEYDFLQISEYGYMIAAQTTQRIAVFDMQGVLLDEYFGENISASLVGRYYTIGDDISLRVYNDQHEMLVEAPPFASFYEGVGDQLLFSAGAFGESGMRIFGTDHAYQNIYPLGEIQGKGIYAAVSVNAVKYENHMLNEIQYALDMSTVRCGVIGSTGEVLLDFDYMTVEMLGDDRLLVCTESEWQMIDIAGKIYWSQQVKTEASDQ